MKYFFFILVSTISTLNSKSQEMNAHALDSILSIPQTIALKISSPQPRLKEKVELSLDINYVRAQIFKSEFGKFDLAEDIGNTDQDLMIMKINPLQKGKQTIGPISFTMNGTKYTTNKLEYEVIDALPDVDKGVWIRKIFPTDSTVCIIVEQRIPAKSRATIIDENTTKYWAEPLTSNTIMMKSAPSINGLEYSNSSNYSDEGYFYNDKKEQIRFLNGYSINYFRIIDKKSTIKITKNDFINLPGDYKFEDIIVQ